MNKSPAVFYRTLSPSGPLSCFLSLHFTIMQSRAMGISDHILPLGDLLASRLGFGPKGLGFGPQDWDLSLKAGI